MPDTPRLPVGPLILLSLAAFAVADAASHGTAVAWAFVVVVAVAAAMAWRVPGARGAAEAPPLPLRSAAIAPLDAPVAPARPPTPREIFRESLMLGLTGFGGGISVLAVIEQRLVARRGWIRERAFLEAASIAQSLPGAVATNALALIGLRLGGLAGAALATLGFVLPSFLLLLVFGLLYAHVRDVGFVEGLLRGLRPAVAGLVAATAVRLGSRLVPGREGAPGGWRALLRDRWGAITLVLAALAVAVLRIGVLETLLLAGLAGLVRGVVLERTDNARAIEARWRWLRRFLFRAAHGEPAGARGWRRWFSGPHEPLGAMLPFALPLQTQAPGLMERLHVLGTLCGVFLRAGATTFGGGFVMIPLLRHELVDARGWLTPRAFADAMALGQVTPGPVVITATFVGYTLSGLAGALLATASVFLPAFVMVLVVGKSVARFQRSAALQAFLHGIQPAVVGVMLAASVTMMESAGFTGFNAAVALGAFAALASGRVGPIVVFLAGSAAGLIARATG